MKRKKGFVFIETIIVTCVLLTSLMIIYAMYVTSLNSESRYLRYDDTAKLYETFYIKKYLESFYIEDVLVNSLKQDCRVFSQEECNEARTCGWSSSTSTCEKKEHFTQIYQGRSDVFGNSSLKEMQFFDYLWNILHVKNIYLLPPTITSDISDCKNASSEYIPICSNNNLLTYLRSIDINPNGNYVIVIEFSSSRSGGNCNSSDCVFYYSYMTVGDKV